MNCETTTINVGPTGPLWIKQHPYVGEDGIYAPCQDYAQQGLASAYRLVISKEMFIEAYNKWIKGEQK